MTTSKKDIVDYWSDRISESDIAVDWIDAEKCCWMCGAEAPLERCHIIPNALGGRDEPDNLVLLCHSCHVNAPNVNDSQFMWSWIKRFHTTLVSRYRDEYIDFLYFKMYGIYFYDELEIIIKMLIERNKMSNEQIETIISNVYENSIIHFGEGELNDSTLVGNRRLSLIAIVKEYNLDYQISI